MKNSILKDKLWRNSEQEIHSLYPSDQQKWPTVKKKSFSGDFSVTEKSMKKRGSLKNRKIDAVTQTSSVTWGLAKN